MKKIAIFTLILIGTFACQQKLDACDCGKKMVKGADDKEVMDCHDYFRSLDYDAQEKWMTTSLKCYMNEKNGTSLK